MYQISVFTLTFVLEAIVHNREKMLVQYIHHETEKII